MKLDRKKGINLLELMIVVAIIGVLVGIAVPQYLNVVEKQKASEAVQLLGVLRQAQIRYQAANASYANGCSVLDVEWSTPVYFAQPLCALVDPIVTIQRNANTAYGQYSFGITEDGAIACTNGAVAGACAKIGY